MSDIVDDSMVIFEQHRGICWCYQPFTSNLMHLNGDCNDLIMNMQTDTIYNFIGLIHIYKILFVIWLRIEKKEQQNCIFELCITSMTKTPKLALVLHNFMVVSKLELEYHLYCC